MGNLVSRRSQPHDAQLSSPLARSKRSSQPTRGDRQSHSIAARRVVPRHQLRFISMPASNPPRSSVSMSATICDIRQKLSDPTVSPCIARRKYFPALADCHDGMHHTRLTLAPSPAASYKPNIPHAILASSPELRAAPACLPQPLTSAAGSGSGRAYQPQACCPAADSAIRPVQTIPKYQCIDNSHIAAETALWSKGQWQPGPRAAIMLDRSAAAQTQSRAPTQGLASASAVTAPVWLPHDRGSNAATIASRAADGTARLRAETMIQAYCTERSSLPSTAFPAGQDQSAPCLVRACDLPL